MGIVVKVCMCREVKVKCWTVQETVKEKGMKGGKEGELVAGEERESEETQVADTVRR